MAAATEPEDRKDPKAYYGYLFDDSKGPTKVLDALLRAIAQYIVCASPYDLT